MKIILSVFAVLYIHLACGQTKEPVYESESLKIMPLGERLYVHVSYLNTDSWGKVGCNGMIFIDGDEAIVYDTPVDDMVSEELINWIVNDQKKTIKAVVATHFHPDCLGGINAFHSSGITSYASERTLELLRKKGAPTLPQKVFEGKQKLKIGEEKVFIYHFGEGHTSDNVVGYIPSEEALFGGCLIKSMNASKGNLEDANVAQWSLTVENIKSKLPDLQTVIPGHGTSGGPELLDYTISLFSEDQTKNQ